MQVCAANVEIVADRRQDIRPEKAMNGSVPVARSTGANSSSNDCSRGGAAMQYALLIYSTTDGSRPEAERLGPIDPRIAAVLERPSVLSWARLRDPESATTIRHDAGKTLLVDGPFIDSKEFLGGVIVVEANDLDGALAIADELQKTRTDGAIEVRPLLP
jgi:hypothetical protein